MQGGREVYLNKNPSMDQEVDKTGIELVMRKLLHSFILEDTHDFPIETIQELGEETAFRRADLAGWTEIELSRVPVIVKLESKTLYLFEITGFGSKLSIDSETKLLKKLMNL